MQSTVFDVVRRYHTFRQQACHTRLSIEFQHSPSQAGFAIGHKKLAR
jgi:hypothetical protein